MKFSIRRFNEWLIVILLLILVPAVYSFIRGDVYLQPNNIHYIFNTHPTTITLGISTVDAINIFAGDAPLGFTINWETASMFLNVVMYLMIGPFLLFKGYKKAKVNENWAKPWYWYIGGVICLAAFSIVPIEIIHMQVFENTKESAAESRTIDMMRDELADVSFATAQYEILENGISESFTIEDLNLENLKYEYSIENIQSDTLITLAVSNPSIPDFTVKMDVRPNSQRIIKQRN